MRQKLKVFFYSILMALIFGTIHVFFPDSWNSPVKQAIDDFLAGDMSNLMAFIGLALLALLISFFGVICFCIIEPNKGTKQFYYPEISIIIAARDEAPLIKQTLKSIVATTYPKEKIEVLMVTSNSKDDSELVCEKFASKHPEIKWKVLSKPMNKLGKPTALNYGLKHVKHDILVSYDAGSILMPDTLKHLVAPFKDERIQATQGAIAVKNWEVNGLTRGILFDYALVSAGNSFCDVMNKMGRNCWLYGRNFAVRLAVLKELGGFDEQSLTEDFFLASTMNAHGKKIKFVSAAKMQEYVPGTWDVLKKQRMRWVGGFTGDIPRLVKLEVDGKKSGLREVISRFFYMEILGNISTWWLIDIACMILYGLLQEFYLLLWSVMGFLFHLGWVVTSITRYAGNNFSCLKSYGTTVKAQWFMVGLSTHLPKEISWEKTPMILSRSKEEVEALVEKEITVSVRAPLKQKSQKIF